MIRKKNRKRLFHEKLKSDRGLKSFENKLPNDAHQRTKNKNRWYFKSGGKLQM